MSDHVHTTPPEAQVTPLDNADPACDSCYAKKSEVGGEFHVWESQSGSNAVYCDLCHNALRATAAREEQIMRAVGPGIARLRRHWTMSLKEILEALGELAEVDEARLERMMAGGTESWVRPFRDGDTGSAMTNAS